MTLNIKIKGCGITTYETVNLPTADVENGTMIFDKTQGKPLYYSDGHWYRFSDNESVHIIPREESKWITQDGKRYYIDTEGRMYKLLLRQDTQKDGGIWVKGQTIPNNDPENNFQYLDFDLNNEPRKWDRFKGKDGTYEFKMRWKGIEETYKYNDKRGVNFQEVDGNNVIDWMTWTQTSVPGTTVEDLIILDEGRNDMYTNSGIKTNTFQGLFVSGGTNSFADGNEDDTWFYGAGLYSNNNMSTKGQIPVMLSKLNDNDQEWITHTKVEIWVRVPIQIYLIAGQSNAVGFGDTTSYAPDLSDVQFWNRKRLLADNLDKNDVTYLTADSDKWKPGEWGDMEVGNTVKNRPENEDVSKYFGYEVPLANLVTKPAHFIKYAKGNTNLHTEWNPDLAFTRLNPGGTKNQYTQWSVTFDEAIAALGKQPYQIMGMFWMQGESDTTTEDVAKDYGKNLQSLIEKMRQHVGFPDMKFFIGKLNYWPTGPHDRIGIIRNKQDAVAAADGNVFTIETNELSLHDSIHYNGESLIKMAQRFHDAMSVSLPVVDLGTPHWTTIDGKKYYVDEYGDTYRLLLRQDLKIDMNGVAWTNGKTYGGWDISEKATVINTKQLNSDSDPESVHQYIDFALTDSEWDLLKGSDTKLTFKMRWPEMREDSVLTNIEGINDSNVVDFMTWKQTAPNSNQIPVDFEEINFGINEQMYKHNVGNGSTDFQGIFLNDLGTDLYTDNKLPFIDGNMGTTGSWWAAGVFGNGWQRDGQTILPLINKGQLWYSPNIVEIWVKRNK
jgi:hypothetical protein